MKNKRNIFVLILLLLIIAIIVIAVSFKLISARSAEKEIAATAPPEMPKDKTTSILVQGIGRDLYYVYDALTDKQVDFTKTNKEIAVAPGKYKVTLNAISQDATAEDGQKAILQAGTLQVSGIAQDMYYVFDSAGKQRLDSRRTNDRIELFPGSYTVSLNQIQKSFEIQARTETTLEAGTLAISGNQNALYYVYDSTGENKLDFRGGDRKMELFPGQYLVVINEKRQTVEIKANQEATITP